MPFPSSVTPLLHVVDLLYCELDAHLILISLLLLSTPSYSILWPSLGSATPQFSSFLSLSYFRTQPTTMVLPSLALLIWRTSDGSPPWGFGRHKWRKGGKVICVDLPSTSSLSFLMPSLMNFNTLFACAPRHCIVIRYEHQYWVGTMDLLLATTPSSPLAL